LEPSRTHLAPAAAEPGRATFRLDLGSGNARLTRRTAAADAVLTLASGHRGERTISISFSSVCCVRDVALSALLTEAARLLEPWGSGGRLELDGLRPRVRRTVLPWLERCELFTLTAAGRRTIVAAVSPRADDPRRLSPNRRRMLLLGLRDGQHCVWCRRPLSHASPNATVDHVLCRSRGGNDTLANLVLACAACNHRRSDSPAELWLERCAARGLDVDERAVVAAIGRSRRSRRRRLGSARLDEAAAQVAAAGRR
jgi:5-methylcytosine-specific restriction endonuclease McrA